MFFGVIGQMAGFFMFESFSFLDQSLLATVSGLFGLMLGAGAWALKERSRVLMVAAAGSFFWAIHFYEIGALTAGFLNVAIALRTFATSRVSGRREKMVVFFFFGSVFSIMTAMSWQGWLSLLPFAGTMVSTFSYSFLDNVAMRKVTFLSSFFWISNSIAWGSYQNVVAEVLRSSMTAIGLARLKNT